MRWYTKILLGLWLVLLLASSGCLKKNDYPEINLKRLQPSIRIDGSHQETSLKVALASITSPKESLVYYGELLQYMENCLGHPVKIIQRKTYKEVNDLIAAGDVDLAFICTYSYIQGAEDFGLEAFLVPRINDKTTYQSYIIVPNDSSAKEFLDLRQKSFAFTDPDSTTGFLYPNWLLKQINETPDTFFRSAIFTYSHDNSIKAVADGVVDGAAIDGLVLDYILEKQPEFSSKVKIINKSEEFGMPPVIVSPGLNSVEREKIWEVLTSIHLDPKGMEILEKIGIESFLPQDDAAYDTIRELGREVVGD